MEQAVTRLYDSSRLTHDRLDSGIHIFTFHESSRHALDEWFARVEQLWRDYATHQTPIRVLIDSSACGTQPLNYALQRARKFMAQFEPRPVTRTAFLEKNMVMVRLLDAFLHMLAKNPRVRYFRESERAEAMTWLEAPIS